MLRADEQIQKARRRGRVEAAGRFVGQEYLGFVGQGAGDGHPLSFAAREFGREPVLTATEIDLGQEFEGSSFALAGGPPVPNIGSSTLARAESWGSRLWNWKTRPTSFRR